MVLLNTTPGRPSFSRIQGGTYSGNAVSCAAAVATTDVMMQTDLLSNVKSRSDQIFAGLRAIAADEKNGGWMIAEVRGIGVSRNSSRTSVDNSVFKNPITNITVTTSS